MFSRLTSQVIEPSPGPPSLITMSALAMPSGESAVLISDITAEWMGRPCTTWEHEPSRSAGWHWSSAVSPGAIEVPAALTLPSTLVKFPSRFPEDWRLSISGVRTWMRCLPGVWRLRSWHLLFGTRLLGVWRNVAIFFAQLTHTYGADVVVGRLA